jgi:hypothetical protein
MSVTGVCEYFIDLPPRTQLTSEQYEILDNIDASWYQKPIRVSVKGFGQMWTRTVQRIYLSSPEALAWAKIQLGI